MSGCTIEYILLLRQTADTKQNRVRDFSSRSSKNTRIGASGSVGGAPPCQGGGRGFESRLALLLIKKGHIQSDMSFFN